MSLQSLFVLAQQTPSFNGNNAAAAGAAVGGAIFMLIYLAIIALVIAGFWKTFAKAGQPGWMAIIPILNIYILLKIVGRPAWWLLLFFIPIVSFVMLIIVALDVAKVFNKSQAFGIGLAFLPFVFYPMLGFGDATYNGPMAPPGFTPIPA